MKISILKNTDSRNYVFMAKIPLGILGPLKGKCGPVIGMARANKGCVKAVSASFNDRKSEKQLLQRDAFTKVVKFLSPIRALINKGFITDVESTAFNKAVSHNLKEAVAVENDSLTIDYSKTLISKGNTVNIKAPSATITNNKATITWTDNSAQTGTKESDRVEVVVYNVDKEEYMLSPSDATRKSGSTIVDIPEDWAGDKVIVYVSTATEGTNGTIHSDSKYIGEYDVA